MPFLPPNQQRQSTEGHLHDTVTGNVLVQKHEIACTDQYTVVYGGNLYILRSQARRATEVDALCGWLRARPNPAYGPATALRS